MASEGEGVDAIKQLADSLREKKGVPWSVAKYDVGEADTTYVEFFRGKDFLRYFQANPAKLSKALPAKAGAGKSVEEQVADLMALFLRRKLVRKTDRKFKKPKPGKKRLVKFPKTLEPHPEPNGWTEEAFYAWTYDRPTSLWYYVGTIALPFLVIAACLFPLAPWWVRMTIVYLLMTVLAVLLSLIAVRYVLFGAVWIVSGSSFWLFPNMMSDEVAIFDAFSPIIEYKKAEKGKKQWLARLAALALAGGVVYMLYTHAPDAAQLKQQAKEAHDSILDYLDVYGKHKAQGFLTNGTTNGTAAGSSSSGGGGGHGSAGGRGSAGSRSNSAGRQDL